MKHKKGSPTMTLSTVDFGTQERHQHGSIVLDETMDAGIRRARVQTECIIDRYYERMQIIDRQKAAGIELRKLWMRAVHPAAVTSAYGESRGNGGGTASGIDARMALRVALEGAGLARRFMVADQPLLLTKAGMNIWMERYPSVLLPAGQVAIAVCGLDEWAGGTRRLTLLREALSALATFWKIKEPKDEIPD